MVGSYRRQVYRETEAPNRSRLLCSAGKTIVERSRAGFLSGSYGLSKAGDVTLRLAIQVIFNRTA